MSSPNAPADEADSSRVESLRKQAKQWLKALRAGDAPAVARLRAALPDQPLGRAPTLRTVQLALARERGLPLAGASCWVR